MVESEGEGRLAPGAAVVFTAWSAGAGGPVPRRGRVVRGPDAEGGWRVAVVLAPAPWEDEAAAEVRACEGGRAE